MFEKEGFSSEKLSGHIYRITDALDVCCYLVVGSRKACLLDTCTGVGDLKNYISGITELPVQVILSHGHMDHIGGAGLFEDVYMSHEELPIFAIHGEREYRCSFFNSHLSMNLKIEDFAEVDAQRIQDIKDGTVLDLGGVTVKLLMAKGHTPGMICPLVVEDRAIVIGDACDDNVLLFDEFSSNVSIYKENLLRIKNMGEAYDFIYGNHGDFVFSRELIENVLECCDLILGGKDAHIPTKSLGAEMFSCFATGADGKRLDGKVGNVLYSTEKAL